MLAGTLRQRIRLEEKTVTQGALGQTVVWKPIQRLYGRRIPLDVKTIAQYQQLNTVVTDKFLLRGTVTASLGVHRIVHGANTYIPQVAAKHYDGVTEIVARKT